MDHLSLHSIINYDIVLSLSVTMSFFVIAVVKQGVDTERFFFYFG